MWYQKSQLTRQSWAQGDQDLSCLSQVDVLSVVFKVTFVHILGRP